MAHDDPFALDLFGGTALSPGLGVTAFAAKFEGGAEDDDPPPALPPAALQATEPAQIRHRPIAKGENFHFAGTRGLAKSWRDRARENLSAIRLAARITDEQRSATAEEQGALIRFTGFGASDLANGVFRRPGEEEFREGWDEIGSELETIVDRSDYASLRAREMAERRRSREARLTGMDIATVLRGRAGEIEDFCIDTSLLQHLLRRQNHAKRFAHLARAVVLAAR